MRALLVFFVCGAATWAQSLPATHSFSGLDATSARTRLERDGPRPYMPKGYIYPLPCPAAVESFPGLKLPGQQQELQRPVSMIRIVKPEFRLAPHDLGIAEQYDILFFGTTRLVRLRVQLTTQGERLTERWLKPLRSFFDFLDRDGDGYLNHFEAEFVLPNIGMQQMLTSGFFTPSFGNASQLFADFDLDQDGRINFAEFANHYVPSANRMITVQANPLRDFYAEPLTQDMFQLLDTNKDGKLSQQELQACETFFATRDTDEDECLVPLELAPNLFQRPIAPQPIRGTPKQPDIQQQPIVAYKVGAIPDAIIEQLLTRYDKDKNLRLSAAESPFDADVFKKLDKNNDGELTITELVAWRDLPADMDIEMKLAPQPDQNSITLGNNRAAKAVQFQSGGSGLGIVKLGLQSVQLSCNAPRAAAMPINPQFFVFPDGGKGYLTEKDIVGPQFQALRVLFDFLDRDSDGKVTRAEFDALSRIQNDFRNTPLTLVYGTQTPSLFHLMDTNGDGRLTIREVRTAWTRLLAFEPDGKEYVTRAALQPQGSIRFGRTNEVFNANPLTTYTQQPVRQTTRGPLWFRKLDRNGDGDLSRREFPGTAEEFAAIDTDNDGYISPEEAEAFDKRMRKAER